MILEITASALPPYCAMASHGNSDTARFIGDKLQSGRRHLQHSQVLGLYGKGVLYDLYRVYEECLKPDWDGYGSLPVSITTLHLVKQFIDALPLGTPQPSLGAEPDGHLTLEWHYSVRRTLSVSIGPEGEIHYAALLGAGKAYGTEVFYGEVPRKIVDLIYEVMPW
jgi:hypothetical protein